MSGFGLSRFGKSRFALGSRGVAKRFRWKPICEPFDVVEVAPWSAAVAESFWFADVAEVAPFDSLVMDVEAWAAAATELNVWSADVERCGCAMILWEGNTQPGIDVRLTARGKPIDLTGCTVTLRLVRASVAVTVIPCVVDENPKTARVTGDSSGLKAGRYEGRFDIVGVGQLVTVPDPSRAGYEIDVRAKP